MNKKKITLITGTSRGIGKFLVNYYLAKDHIVIGCSRNPSEIVNSNYFHFELDVSDEIKVKQIFSFIRKEFGRLDVLINNAGIASMNHSVLTPTSTAKKILETNVIGKFLFLSESFVGPKLYSNSFATIFNLGVDKITGGYCTQNYLVAKIFKACNFRITNQEIHLRIKI